MKAERILYHPTFSKDLRKLDVIIIERAIKTESQFRKNPLHPSLRLHPLKGKLDGLWSISVTMSIRIIFERMENGDVVFLSIGKHDLYRAW